MAVYTYTTEVVKSIFHITSPTNHEFELATYSYNPSSSVYIDGEDYGLISSIIDTYEDYGSVAETATQYDDYDYITTTTKPTFGLIRRIVSTSVIGFNLGSVGGITFAIQGGAYQGFGLPYIGYGGISNIFGGLTKESYVPATEVGSGTLFNFINKEERRTYSYNGSSIILKVDEDYGTVSQSHVVSDDYGSVAEVVNTPGSEDYGSITTSDKRPYGSFRFAGNNAPLTRFSLRPSGSGRLFGFGGGAEAIVPFIPSQSGLFKVVGTATETTVPAPHVGSGTLFNFITKEERRTYSYNGSSTIVKVDEDYGLITEVHSNSDSYGSVAEVVNTPGSEDYGSITTSDKRPYGSLRFSGDASKTVNFILTANPEGGSLFGIGGSAESRAKVYPIVSDYPDIITVTAEDIALNPSTVLQNTSFYQGGSGVGSIGGFDIGPHIRFGTFGQDGSRSVRFYLDLRGVEEIIISAIKGNNSNGGEEPDANENLRIEFTGVLGNQIVVAENDTTFNTLNEKTISVPVGARNRYQEILLYQEGNSGNIYDHYGFKSLYYTYVRLPEVKNLLSITGSATETTVPAPHVGSGTLFNFITKEERRTYSYNGSSIILKVDEDYGFVSDNYSDSDSYGFVSQFANSPNNEDYGSITTSDKRPYGSLRFSGDNAQTTRFLLRYIGSGSAFALSGSAEATTANPPASALFTFSGAATEKNLPNYVGSGTLFNFITKEERRTYSYNSSSVVGEDLVEDYGIISESAFTSSDYGYVYESADPVGIDYGNISDSIPTTKKPFGLFTVAGAAHQSFTPATEVGSGSLFSFGSGAEATASSIPLEIGLFKFSGGLINESYSPGLYTGSGTLFNFITKEERRTYSYNGSSIILKVDEDYGFVTVVNLDSDDYGSITEFANSPNNEDYGSITTLDERPYGSLRFSGDNAQTTRFRQRYFGSGRLFGFGSGAEATAPSIALQDKLFKFSGTAAESTTPATEVGSGTLFNFITKEERRTYSYNGSSVVLIETEDYGFTNTTHTESDDYGLVIDQGIYFTEDYGQLSAEQIRPFGRLRISGGATNLQATNSFAGSGNLFVFTGATVVSSIASPAGGRLRFSGTAAESTTPATEVGSGSLFVFVSSTESAGLTPPVTPILLRIAGAATDIKSSAAEFSSGTLFAFTGSAESFGAKPPVSGLLKFRSNTAEVFTRANAVTGILRSRSQSAIYDSTDKIRLVAAFESTSSVPAITGGAIRVQGELGRIFFQYRERGVGRFTIAGDAIIKTNPIHFGSGFINVRGSSPEAIVPAPHIGSGSLFTFVNGEEATVPAVEIGSTLFKFFGGASDIKETNREVGSGRIRVNIESSITPIWDYPGKGTLSVLSDTDTSKSKAYLGKETLKFRGIADDYFTNRFFSYGDPIRLRRTDTPHSFAKPIIGTGSLFAFSSTTEATGANPPERILPIKLSGSAVVSRTEVYSGSGFVIGRHKSAIGGVTLDLSITTISELADKIVGDYANIPINAPKSVITGEEQKQSLVAAYESVTASPESKDRAIRIIGSRERENLVPINIGSGRLVEFGGTAESVSFVPGKTTELFKVVGTSEETTTTSEFSSGSLFGFGSGTESFFATIPPEPSLIKITGTSPQSFTPAPHIGSGVISGFTGSSESSTFSPDTRTLFTFTGSSENSLTKDYSGSGNIFAFTGSAVAYAYDYEITQRAFRIFGSTFESFGKSNYFGECQAQFIGSSLDSKITFVSPKPPQLYIM